MAIIVREEKMDCCNHPLTHLIRATGHNPNGPFRTVSVLRESQDARLERERKIRCLTPDGRSPKLPPPPLISVASFLPHLLNDSHNSTTCHSSMAGAGNYPDTRSLLPPPESPQVIGKPPLMDHSKKMCSSLADLTDDLLVEILSRLPGKSVCRSKFASRHWRGIITHRAHRKKLPQTLSGFFSRHISHGDRPCLESILGGAEQHVSDPSLPFLAVYTTVCPVNCCNGLLLCLCSKDPPNNEENYVVCNPATEKWLVLPDSGRQGEVFARRLCFDPAISSGFHVLSILEGADEYVADVEIYSSEGGEWSHKENGWAEDTMLYDRSVFLNGMLHFISTNSTIVTVDKEGKTWKSVPLLETMIFETGGVSNDSSIHQSQGRLHYLNVRDRNPSTLSVWVLDNYHSGKWIFKYNINTSKLFEHKGFRIARDYTLISIHPECNLIFLIFNGKNLLLSYDLDRGKVHVIRHLRDRFNERCNPYLSCVPLFTETEPLTNHQ